MRSFSIFLCVFIMLLLVNASSARIIHIPTDSSTIQGGIDGAQIGDTVLVAPNTYADNINFLGKAITVMSEQGPEVTIIDGYNAGSVVTFISGEDSNSTIKGFTLTRGYAEYGGGIYCYGSSPNILNNFLVGNACFPYHGGPAIYCGYGSNAKIYRNLICHSDGAAAIFIHVEDSVRVVNNTVCDNNWGGLSIQGNSYAYMKNNIFFKNAPYGIHASLGGYGLYRL
jgi:serine protease